LAISTFGALRPGREYRTVEIDPDRGPLMAWAFEAYASGDWTLRRILDELTERGLTTAPGARGPGKPLNLSHLHALMRNPYYSGIVRYRGALYPRKHTPLVSAETFRTVQGLLTAKRLAGEKQRQHPHYLKGSIFCGQCGSRLIVCHAKGRGGIYPYFICIGRQQKRNDCKQRALRIEQVEESVAAYYATVQLPADELGRLGAYLNNQLASLSKHAERERATHERRLRKLGDEQQKLLAARYAEAIPLDLLRSEQDRITTEIATAEGRLAAAAADFQTAKTNLEHALTRIGDCQAAYREASPSIRRQFNLAFFTRLLVDDE
jgi:site-specific DNA recombinase